MPYIASNVCPFFGNCYSMIKNCKLHMHWQVFMEMYLKLVIKNFWKSVDSQIAIVFKKMHGSRFYLIFLWKYLRPYCRVEITDCVDWKNWYWVSCWHGSSRMQPADIWYSLIEYTWNTLLSVDNLRLVLSQGGMFYNCVDINITFSKKWKFDSWGEGCMSLFCFDKKIHPEPK